MEQKTKQLKVACVSHGFPHGFEDVVCLFLSGTGASYSLALHICAAIGVSRMKVECPNRECLSLLPMFLDDQREEPCPL